jgi:hypothetical protein
MVDLSFSGSLWLKVLGSKGLNGFVAYGGGPRLAFLILVFLFSGFICFPLINKYYYIRWAGVIQVKIKESSWKLNKPRESVMTESDRGYYRPLQCFFCGGGYFFVSF